MFSKETYIKRRSILKETIGSGVLLFIGNDDCGMNYEDNTYPFRQDSTFLYYFGLSYPRLTAIINIDDDKEIIFGDELTMDEIVWMGIQPSLKEKSEKTGIYSTLPYNSIHDYLSKATDKGQKTHYLPPYRAEHEIKLMNWFGIKPSRQTASIPFIQGVVNQRIYKSKEEIVEIEKACDITAEMHLAAIRSVRVGMKEYEIAAALEEVAYASGGRLSFPTIATINGETLHNHFHGNTIKEGDMVLIDAGAETPMGYAGDMSSTIPAGKKFTSRQKEIYDIQVASHTASVEALRPRIPFSDVYDLSAKVICEGLASLGLMKGSAEDAVRAGAHALFYPCGLGHMMGLDVHDMENLGEVWVGYNGKPKSTQFGRKSLRLGRELEAGFVLTIEPGIYFIPQLIDQWRAEKKFTEFIDYDKVEAYKNFGGLRNEEDYLITETGSHRLGKKIPLTTNEVEALR
ncbi:Xaa-Pro aminopeptidase [Dysgonomonas alginatilytica]|uniref:Xaa-Pro aminopeptidase n=1 Tax=Dysgonomonas alginatilytica TaxID=1605892 RepID=A0A2V3PKU6_9BACT|nr:aminopeptidase P family protein [Dysgonomonas alginatilytica]PXV62334.1 Xaa-Pro aminopeptidase [Dysgonomonas alginatilytica]